MWGRERGATTQTHTVAFMARVEPRVPSSLECDWLEKKLSKVGRGRFLSARTLDQKHLRREGLGTKPPPESQCTGPCDD